MKKFFFILYFCFTFLVFANPRGNLLDNSIVPKNIFGESRGLPEIYLERFQDLVLENHMPSGFGNIKWYHIVTLATIYPTLTTTKVTKATSSKDEGPEEIQKQLFVIFNYPQLKQEIAVGKGERLNTLAFLFGCSSTYLGSVLKRDYQYLFKQAETLTSISFLEKIQNAIKK